MTGPVLALASVEFITLVCTQSIFGIFGMLLLATVGMLILNISLLLLAWMFDF
jgi:hypothetical protein